ncbi:NAD(P)H nitroreductase [Nocardia sp. NEAU-G5]|uniref:NAD(P)H nitroreductase n=1 Tax=Nocardia albiluteola TaxID=2842303 RepID=A0ABS6AZF2_9NOCA|nr:NAD(P)H nitroreductase [Nocardia albiluteola]MBU3062380.1 NAD(P)H nitroreductase [Nocardia albiluteola]
MPSHEPDHDTVRAALALAVRAPSVHNTQPWLWRLGDETLHLYADRSRQLPHTDPDGRDLIVSCGAALHHLRVAMRASGWETVVHRLPNPGDPDHLAAIEFAPGTPTVEAARLARAMSRRCSDRRRFTSWEVPQAYLETLAAAAGAHGVFVSAVESGYARTQLMRAFEDAARVHARDSSYGAELARWSGHHAAPQGVPSRSAVVATDVTTRPFADPGLPQEVLHDTDAAERLVVLTTTGDDLLSRLRAGEGASAVLLTATVLGLAGCPLSEPLEVPETRVRIRRDVLQDSGSPQLIIRIGWAAMSAGPLLPTPRRPVSEVLLPLPDEQGEEV